MSYLRKLPANKPSNFHNFSGDEFMGYSPISGEELDPNDRTLTITVTNASTSTTRSARIFGAVKDLTGATQHADITVTVAESSHLQVKTELLQNPFRIHGMKYSVTTANQFSNTVAIFEESSTGGLSKRVWQPLNYRSAQNNLTTQIDAPDFELLVNAKSYIDVDILKNESVTFTLTISEKAEMKNILKGRGVKTMSHRQAPTGLPQIDMVSRGQF
jgi:hypothetical protein